MKKKVIYLSMETKIREYNAKLLFALYALEKGYQVVFGSKYPLNRHINFMPKGIFVGTGVTKALGDDALKAKACGHRAVSFDEEGLSYINQEVFMNTRIKDDIIRGIDYFFTWGKHHNELVQKKAPDLKNISPVGNMRFELLKEKYRGIYDEAVRDLRERYGDFILINSNLKVFNHFVGKERLFQALRSVTFIQNNEDEEFYRDRYAHQEKTFESYKSLLLSIAPKIKPMNIIVRPHSSENKATWQALNLPNVHVENSGNVIPWILAARAVIQKNCTTAAETIYLGKPVITYSVTHDPRFDNDIIKSIGRYCQTEDEVWNTLQNLDAFEEQMQADRAFLSEYVSNMGAEQNAAHAILDIINEIDTPEIDDNAAFFTDRSVKCYLKKLKRSVAAVVRRNSPERKLRRQKFPGLSVGEIKGDIERLSGTLPLSADRVQVAKIDDDLYHLSMNP